jgi:hypothetical protein
MSPLIDLIGSAKGYGWGAFVSGTAFQSIATMTATGGETSLTFSSIPQTYKHLHIRGVYRDSSANSAQVAPIYIQFNTDTGANYNYQSGQAMANSTVSGENQTSQTWLRIAGAGMVSTSGYFGGSIMDIQDYTSTVQKKSVRAISGGSANLTTANYMTAISQGGWNSTAAINEMKIYSGNGNFLANTTFALYGIKGE